MLRIREAGINDIDSVNTILYKSWKSAYRGIIADEYLDHLPADYWIGFINTGIRTGSIFVLLLESEEELIGTAILRAAEQTGEAGLISFYLRPDQIGRGNGHVFYELIETKLLSRGYKSCILDVLEDNRRAIRFYHSHQFNDTGRTTDTVLGNHTYTCKILEKKFSLPGDIN